MRWEGVTNDSRVVEDPPLLSWRIYNLAQVD